MQIWGYTLPFVWKHWNWHWNWFKVTITSPDNDRSQRELRDKHTGHRQVTKRASHKEKIWYISIFLLLLFAEIQCFKFSNICFHLGIRKTDNSTVILKIALFLHFVKGIQLNFYAERYKRISFICLIFPI